MSLFLTLLGSWIVAGLVINLLLRIPLNTRLRDVMYITNKSDYLQGYVAGTTNVKMYYFTIGEIPPTQWLDKVQHTLVDSREKLEATIKNVPEKQ